MFAARRQVSHPLLLFPGYCDLGMTENDQLPRTVQVTVTYCFQLTHHARNSRSLVRARNCSTVAAAGGRRRGICGNMQDARMRERWLQETTP